MLEEAKDDMERISACKALWSICFVREGREAIAKLPDLLQDLNELKVEVLLHFVTFDLLYSTVVLVQ